MTDNFSDNENFADLFNDEGLEKKPLTPGQKITAAIVAVTPDSIFLDVGEKSEGFIDPKELEDEEGNPTVKPGDSLEVYFLSSAKNEMLFTTRIGSGSTTREHLEEAFRSAIPLEGFVKKEIKGGFEVSIAGNIRTFCPFSQMDIKRIADPEEFVGRHLQFIITQYSEGGRNIVLSRRIILEQEKEEKRRELKDSLREGMTVKGRITSIRNFGAFVDLDGIEGLIPISEIGWSRIEDIREVLTEEQEVEVVILKLDWENDRFSFSLKQALPDPWQSISLNFPVGTNLTGTVVKLAKFGAFVNLAEGIDGLVHISKLGGGRRINHPREVLEPGQKIEVKIEEIDADEKRISLSVSGEEPDETSADTSNEGDLQNYIRQAATTQKKQKPIGTFGDILQAKLKEKEQKE